MSPQIVDILIDTSTNCEHTHPTTTKYTSLATNSRIKTEATMPSTKYTSYIQFDTTSNNTKKSKSKSEDTEPCCYKPKTWESTKQTETTKIAFNESFKQTIHDDVTKPIELAVTKINIEVNNNYLLNDSSRNLLNVTDEKVTEINYQMNKTTNILETTLDDRNNPVLLTKGLIHKLKDIINHTSSYLDQWNYTRYCCNRPKAWETTTESVIIVEENPKEIVDTIEENEVDDEKIVLSNKVNSTTFNRTAYPFDVVSSTTRERAVTNELDVLGTKISPYQVLTKRVKKNISKTSMFCNYHKCQRPLTWITTTVTKKRKLF